LATVVLLSILRKLRLKEKSMRVLILGLDNAGKSSVVKTFLGESIDSISPTLGFNIITLAFDDYKLNCWDIGGQKSLRSYWRNYFEQTDALIWVVDSADTDRLAMCRAELDALLGEEKLAGASLLVLANKQDLDGALPLRSIEQRLQLTSIVNRHWRVEACSARTGAGLRDGVSWLVHDVAARVFTLD
jgi:ADP-ribosylation factor-like protein 2